MRTNINLTIPGTNVCLGDRVTDVITGFVGIAIQHTRHLTGCDRIGVEGRAKGDEQKAPIQWFDVQQLVVKDRNAVCGTPMPADIPAAG